MFNKLKNLPVYLRNIILKQDLKSHGLLLLSTLIAGANYTISKFATPEYIAPSAIILLRIIATILLFNALGFFVKEKIDLSDRKRIFLCALFGVACNQLLFYKGLSLTSPINASLMMTVSPIIVLVISAINGFERITPFRILGLLLGTIGTSALLLSGKDQFNELFIGDTLVLLNAVSWALFLVIAKPLLAKYHFITVSRWMFNLGFFLVFPFSINSFMETKWQNFDSTAYLSIGFIIIFATYISYILNVGVLKKVNPSVAGSYIYLQPIFAAFIALMLGKDELTSEKIAYSILILTGVFLINKQPHKKVRDQLYSN
ncbi:DMT family transporter [Sporocytophaga myxococcoides]|uniref:DMT family transporter n=1 Tax=Sporocytophaga myxococcoides TaxID=153721 RepID=UPI00040FAD0F|nr:DMT family transporter [Sporocytophaga myxococcoides]